MPVFSGTVYWQAEDRDGILLMSAYCVYCCASPLFLSSVLMAHLNKALGVSTNLTRHQAPLFGQSVAPVVL